MVKIYETQKKDIVRLIQNTKGRFFSLVAIIIIGVAFFVGVSGSSYIMGKNVDAYADDTNLKDITIYSNYGFDDEDVDAISQMVKLIKQKAASLLMYWQAALVCQKLQECIPMMLIMKSINFY